MFAKLDPCKKEKMVLSMKDPMRCKAYVKSQQNGRVVKLKLQTLHMTVHLSKLEYVFWSGSIVGLKYSLKTF